MVAPLSAAERSRRRYRHKRQPQRGAGLRHAAGGRRRRSSGLRPHLGLDAGQSRRAHRQSARLALGPDGAQDRRQQQCDRWRHSRGLGARRGGRSLERRGLRDRRRQDRNRHSAVSDRRHCRRRVGSPAGALWFCFLRSARRAGCEPLILDISGLRPAEPACAGPRLGARRRQRTGDRRCVAGGQDRQC